MSAFELLMVPLGDFGVCEQGVVAAGEASFHALGDVVVEWEVGSERVVRVLPVTVLRLVDRLLMVSYDASNRTILSRPSEDRISSASFSQEYSQTIRRPSDHIFG